MAESTVATPVDSYYIISRVPHDSALPSRYRVVLVSEADHLRFQMHMLLPSSLRSRTNMTWLSGKGRRKRVCLSHRLRPEEASLATRYWNERSPAPGNKPEIEAQLRLIVLHWFSAE